MLIEMSYADKIVGRIIGDRKSKNNYCINCEKEIPDDSDLCSKCEDIEEREGRSFKHKKK
jgi:hypothetical protein